MGEASPGRGGVGWGCPGPEGVERGGVGPGGGRQGSASVRGSAWGRGQNPGTPQVGVRPGARAGGVRCFRQPSDAGLPAGAGARELPRGGSGNYREARLEEEEGGEVGLAQGGGGCLFLGLTSSGEVGKCSLIWRKTGSLELKWPPHGVFGRGSGLDTCTRPNSLRR